MSFEVDLTRILDEFNEKENETLFKDISKAGKKAKQDLLNNSPKDTGDYSRGWTIRTKKSNKTISVIVHNRTHPRLTHLLEKGHVIRNKYGIFGRAPAHPHIKNAQDKAVDYLMRELKNDL